MHQSLFQEVTDRTKKTVKCCLCPHSCIIQPDNVGICRVRKNSDGTLYSLIYSHHTSVGMDPIEKKPLYHFFPGKQILSFGTLGCNLSCGFCQNWEISQGSFDESITRNINPDDALRLSKNYDSIGIAYTYNEPFVNYEWVFDSSKLLHEEGLKNVLVTNGYINEEPLVKLLPYIDAANIDVKSFTNDFYKKLCKGTVGPVLRTVQIMVKKNVHVEITVLIVPGENDKEDEMKDMVDWLASLNPDIPFHLSRYYPQYHFKKLPTSLKTLEKLRDIALKKLPYVYIGNVWEKGISNTYCLNRNCNNVLIERSGYSAKVVGLDNNLCKKCGMENNIIWNG